VELKALKFKADFRTLRWRGLAKFICRIPSVFLPLHSYFSGENQYVLHVEAASNIKTPEKQINFENSPG
jgi:hypothetical protein